MIIDLSSPIELRGYELLHDDAGSTRAYIDLFNVSDYTVTAYTATAHWSNDASGEGANEYVSVDAISIAGGAQFKLMLSTSLVKYADRLELYFSGVTFENGESWMPQDGDLVNVGETVALEGAELDNLKRAAGDDAIMYPETQDRFWRCVCGRINPLTEDLCARCRRERNYVLAELNRKSVHLSDDERYVRQRRRQKSERASAQARSAEKKKADLYTAILLCCIVGFLAFCLLTIGLSG